MNSVSVQESLRHLFGDGLSLSQELSDRPGKRVFLASLDDERVIVKVFGERNVMDREHEVLELLPHESLRVPQVVARGQDHSHFVLIESFVAGEVPSSSLLREKEVLARLAGDLGEFYAATCKERDWSAARFWVREGAKNTSWQTSGAWRGYLRLRLETWLRRLAGDSLVARDVQAAGISDQLYEVLRDFDQTEYTGLYGLVHGDLSGRNLLFCRSDWSFGLIDFGASMIAPPVYDIAKLAWLELSEDTDGILLESLQLDDRSLSLRLLALYKRIHCVAALAWLARHGVGDAAAQSFYAKALKTLKSA